MPSSSVSFGSFDANLSSGELRKKGVRVKLEQQPFQVLALLLKQPGEIVTREELKDALWADDTFVDFDNGLNTAIRKIRRVLDDSATTPRYIETLPKRGYRFIGPVEGGAGAAAGTSGEQPARAQTRLLWVVAAVAAVAAVILAVVAFRSPETIPTDAGTEPPTIVPLTSLPGIEQHPTFSPDGSQVAFSWNGEDREGFDIYVKPVFGGGPPLRLTDHPADDIMPAWSPDGQSVAFWRSNGDQSGIFLVSPLGGNERKLFDDRRPIADNNVPWSQLSWSPNGKWLAFTDTRSSPAPIASVSAVTGEVRVLTDPPGTYGNIGDMVPAFSPDGRQLAWRRLLGPGNSGIFTMSLAERVPHRRSQVGGNGIAWTGDSQSLVIARKGQSLTRLNLADGSERPIPNTSLAIHPSTALGGGRLAYTMRLLNYDVLRSDLTPDSSKALSFRTILASTRSEFAPQISHDSSRIVLSSWRAGERRLWTLRKDASDPSDIAAGAAPRWSPDKQRIAYDRGISEGGYGVYVVDADGGASKLITDPAKHASRPCWSEDGQTLYFDFQHAGETQIWRKPATGDGEPAQVTRGAGNRCWVSAGWVYFGRGADVWRTSESGTSEEELVLEGRLFQGSGHWQVRGEALYFIDFEEGWRAGRWALKRMDISSRKIVDLAELPQEPAQVNGLSVAPDERWFLYVVDNSTEQDLMMIENFR